jgi:hypothetical protein
MLEVVINDLSLDKQFNNEQDFYNSLLEYTLPILKEMERQGNIKLVKSNEFYKRLVCNDITLVSIFKKTSGNPVVERLKHALTKFVISEPFTDIEESYAYDISLYDEKIEWSESYCIQYAFYNKNPLMSFNHKLFKEQYIRFIHNDQVENVDNFYCLSQFMDILLKFGTNISISKYLNSYKYAIDIEFLTSNNNSVYIDRIFSKGDLTAKDYNLLARAINKHTQLLSDCESNSSVYKPIKYGDERFFEFRHTLSGDRRLRIFYIRKDNKIIYLNGFIKKTQTTPEEEKSRAYKLIKEYNS